MLLERCLLLDRVPAGPLVQGAQEELQEARQEGGQGVRGGCQGQTLNQVFKLSQSVGDRYRTGS